MGEKVGNYRQAICAGRAHGVGPGGREATDCHQRQPADAALPVRDPPEALRGPLHRFEARLVDGPESDVVGRSGERGLEFLLAVRADAEANALGLDGWHIRVGQVLLTQMYPLSAERQRLTPIIID